MTDIKKRTIAVMAAVFAIDEAEVLEDCSYGSFDKWDSMGHMNLIVGIEEEFDIRFSDEEFPELLNLKLIEFIVSKKLQGNTDSN